MTDLHKLLPCPFCGGEAKDDDLPNSIYCSSCGVEAEAHKWNRRAALAEPQEQNVEPVAWLYEAEGFSDAFSKTRLKREYLSGNVRETALYRSAAPQNAAPQPSTADQDTAPSQEGVGQGEAAVRHQTDCNCHPEDYPPVPCQHKRSYSECMRAALASAQAEIAALKCPGYISVPVEAIAPFLAVAKRMAGYNEGIATQVSTEVVKGRVMFAIDALWVKHWRDLLAASGEAKP